MVWKEDASGWGYLKRILILITQRARSGKEIFRRQVLQDSGLLQGVDNSSCRVWH